MGVDMSDADDEGERHCGMMEVMGVMEMMEMIEMMKMIMVMGTTE